MRNFYRVYIGVLYRWTHALFRSFSQNYLLDQNLDRCVGLVFAVLSSPTPPMYIHTTNHALSHSVNAFNAAQKRENEKNSFQRE